MAMGKFALAVRKIAGVFGIFVIWFILFLNFSDIKWFYTFLFCGVAFQLLFIFTRLKLTGKVLGVFLNMEKLAAEKKAFIIYVYFFCLSVLLTVMNNVEENSVAMIICFLLFVFSTVVVQWRLSLVLEKKMGNLILS